MSATTAPVAAVAGTNLTVVVGTLARTPERRVLPSGESVLGLELSVRGDDGPAESVPVAWYAAPAAAERWKEGERVLVSGRTRRRYFRSNGATQSRTEVVATIVVPTRRSAAAHGALEAASAELLGALAS